MAPGADGFFADRTTHPTAQELHLANFSRREAATAARWAAELGVAMPPQPAPPLPVKPLPVKPLLPPQPVATVAAMPPTAEDIYALAALCGGNEAEVVTLLARLWRAPAQAIMPVVASWLAQLPPIPPPSGLRSAPATLPNALEERLSSARPAIVGTGVTLRRGVLRYDDARKAPSLSAPVAGSGLSLSAVLTGLHAASTRISGAAGGNGVRRTSPHGGMLKLPSCEPSFAPVRLSAAEIAQIPEDAVVDRWGPAADEDELANFMARSAVMHERLAPAVSKAQGGANGGRMRF